MEGDVPEIQKGLTAEKVATDHPSPVWAGELRKGIGGFPRRFKWPGEGSVWANILFMAVLAAGGEWGPHN